MSVFSDYNDYKLCNEVDEEYNNMSENEKYMRLKYCDPTFKLFIITSMKEGDSVELNEYI